MVECRSRICVCVLSECRASWVVSAWMRVHVCRSVDKHRGAASQCSRCSAPCVVAVTASVRARLVSVSMARQACATLLVVEQQQLGAVHGLGNGLLVCVLPVCRKVGRGLARQQHQPCWLLFAPWECSFVVCTL